MTTEISISNSFFYRLFAVEPVFLCTIAATGIDKTIP